MTDNWWKLTIPVGLPVAIVLDAGEDAAGTWQTALDLALRLIDSLPQSRPVRVYFLGSGHSYDGQQLSSLGAIWRDAHRMRTRLFNPIFENLVSEPCTTAVVFAGGIPFDIGDWNSSKMINRTIFVAVADLPSNNLLGALCPPDSDSINQRLQQSAGIEVVRISLRGAMPVEWNNSAYQIDGECLEARHAPDYSIKVKWIGSASSSPQAACVGSDGSVQQISLSQCGATHEAWQPLSHHESDAFRDAIAGEKIRCPFGNHEHAPGAVSCRDGKNFPGKPLYGRDLTGFSGFVVLRADSDSVEYHKHAGTVLHVGPNLVAVAVGQRAILKQFQPATDQWTDVGDFGQYCPIGENRYAIVL